MDLHLFHRRHVAALLADGKEIASADFDPFIPMRPEDVRWTISFDGTLDETDQGLRRAMELDQADAVAPLEIRFDTGEIWRCPAKFVVLRGREKWRVMAMPLIAPAVIREADA